MKEFIRVQNCVLAINAIISIELGEKTIFIRTTEAGYHFYHDTETEARIQFESLWNHFAA